MIMIGALITLALTVLFFMAVEAISVASYGYVFLDLGFWDCWHAAWNKPGWLLIFALITMIFARSVD